MLFSALKAADYKAPVVALFWGTACIPCERLKPKLKEVCEKLSVRLELFHANAEMDAVRELNIRMVPTAVVVHKGKITPCFSGDLNVQEILVKVGAATAAAIQ